MVYEEEKDGFYNRPKDSPRLWMVGQDYKQDPMFNLHKHMEEKTVQKMKENVFSIMFGLMLDKCFLFFGYFLS